MAGHLIVNGIARNESENHLFFKHSRLFLGAEENNVQPTVSRIELNNEQNSKTTSFHFHVEHVPLPQNAKTGIS